MGKHGRLASCWSVLFFCILLTASVEAQWFKDLLNPYVSLWGPIQSDSSLEDAKYGFTNIPGFIAAFGDFNSDKHVDVFVVGANVNNETLLTLQVFTWSPGTEQYQPIDTQITDQGIEAVIPNDFNGDGMLDVLVQVRQAGTTQTTIYYGDRREFTSSYVLNPAPSINCQPLLMDYNLDLKADIFGVADGTQERGFWINQGDAFTFEAFPNTTALHPVADPNSNAFVDMNGDCLADLVIISEDETSGIQYMEIWFLTGTSLTLSQIIELPQGAGQISFADLDRDGTTDFLFPSCYPSPTCSDVNSITIVYNVQQPMCTSITGNGDDCIDSSNVCGTPQEFTIPSQIPTSSTANVVVMDSTVFDGFTFFWTFPMSTNAPNTLRLGDYNADGFTDFLVVVETTNSTMAQLWDSVPCTTVLCGEEATNANRRAFSRSSSAGAIESVVNPFAATFFDIADDGTLDMFVLSYPIKQPKTAFSITSIQNSVSYGTYFMKAVGLSGLCMQWCDTEPKFPDPKPIGINQPGGVFKYIWSDNDSNKRVTISTQLSQSGYLALQTPYVYFGLGDVSNYIQYIYYGAPIQNGVSKIILRNSNVY